MELQTSSHLLWLYSLFGVGPGYKPKDRFSHDTAHIILYRENDKTKLFVDESQFATILESKRKISATLQEINDHRREVRLTTRQPSLEYTTVMGTEVSVTIKNMKYQRFSFT